MCIHLWDAGHSIKIFLISLKMGIPTTITGKKQENKTDGRRKILCKKTTLFLLHPHIPDY